MRKRLKKVLLFGIVGCIIGFFYYLLKKMWGISFPCIFFSVTGLYCPGCGITRMFSALIELDFETAFRSNQIIFLMLPFFLLIGFEKTIKYVIKGTVSLSKFQKNFLIICIVILIVFGVLRNLSC